MTGLKGGALISVVHSYEDYGDPCIQEFTRRLLSEVTKPFYQILTRWIYEGELEDPFEEFYVLLDKNVDAENMWRAQYSMQFDMVPSFMSKSSAKKV